MEKKEDVILSPIVRNLNIFPHPLGKEIRLQWRQSRKNGYWILRRPWRWPSGREIPLLEVDKSSFVEALFPSPYAYLDGFRPESTLEKVETYQVIEKEYPKTGILFVLEYYQEVTKLRVYQLEGSLKPLHLLDTEELPVLVQSEKKNPKSEVFQISLRENPQDPLIEIKTYFDEEGERKIQVKLITREVEEYKGLQILTLERKDDHLLGDLRDVGVTEEVDYYYSFIPKEKEDFQKVQDHARALGHYQMEDKLYRYLPSHYITKDNQSQLRRFIESLGFSLNKIRGTAEELRDLQDVDRCRLEMLPLLAKWIGWDFPRSDLSNLRQDLKEALFLYRRKGTKKGLKELIQKLTGKECKKIIEYRQSMFFTNEPLNRTTSRRFKTCYHPPSTIDIEFAPFEEWKGNVGLKKERLKLWLKKFLPAHVKIGEITYTILPRKERYSGVTEKVRTVLASGSEKVLPPRAEEAMKEKVSTSIRYQGKELHIWKTNTTGAQTNDFFYRTYHSLIEQEKRKSK